MRSTPLRPSLALGALALAFVGGRARADQGAPPAGGPLRVAQAPPPPVYGPLGRSRSDQAPGNDSAAGRPRSPAPGENPSDPSRGGPGSDRSPTGGLGSQTQSVPPVVGPPTPDGTPDAKPPAGADMAGMPPQTEPPGKAGDAKAGDAKAAPIDGPPWRAELPSDRFLRPLEPRPHFFEIGPSVLYEIRTTKSGGPAYKSTFAPSIAFRARLLSWLVIGARYRTVAHDITLPANAFGLEGNAYDMPRPTFVRSLDAYLHPTLHPTRWLSTWATVGIGWGQITVSPLLVTDPPNGPSLKARTGVFADVPLGGGVAYNLPFFPLLSVSFEALFEPVFYQEGVMYEHTRFVNSATGQYAEATPMSRLSHSFATALGVSLSF